jgi:predicted DNA-binding transcriptional regulator YafY
MPTPLILRYIWLADTISRAGRITFQGIADRWRSSSLSEGEELPLRTFHHHRKAIESMFDINIECDKSTNEYYIEDSEDLKKGALRNWLLSTFSVNNLLSESQKLRDRIMFEHIPSGQGYLAPIIEAMKDGVVLEMRYQSFWAMEPKSYALEPYFVRIFKQRWYVVGRNCELNKIRIFALDRISELSGSAKKYRYPKSFDPEMYYHDCYGITNDDETEVVKVVVRVSERQYRYMKALPLHHSQTVVEQGAEFSELEFYLKPSFDFKQELLSYGADVELLEPEWLRREFADTVRTLMERYSK